MKNNDELNEDVFDSKVELCEIRSERVKCNPALL